MKFSISEPKIIFHTQSFYRGGGVGSGSIEIDFSYDSDKIEISDVALEVLKYTVSYLEKRKNGYRKIS